MALPSADQCRISASAPVWATLPARGVSPTPPTGTLPPAELPVHMGLAWDLAAGDVGVFAGWFVAGLSALLCILDWKPLKEMISSIRHLDLSQGLQVRSTSAHSTFHREI